MNGNYLKLTLEKKLMEWKDNKKDRASLSWNQGIKEEPKGMPMNIAMVFPP